MTCRVYRHFDEAGTLLYVGIAACALRRLDQHRLSSKWFGDVRRVHIDPCESREEALRLEQLAIKHERPLHNGPVGRPRVVGDRPWHIEGISRATWYRKSGMTDQLKALGDAKRAARKSSDGSRESRPAPERISPSKEERPLRPPLHMAKAVLGNSKAVSVGKKSARVAPGPSEAKRGRGRPKVEGPKPWEVEGISKTSYYRYRRQAEKK